MIPTERLVRSLSTRAPAARQAALVAGCVLGGAALRLALGPLLAGSVPFVTFFPAVLIASLWGGVRAGGATLLLASAVASWLWLEPMGTVALTKLGATSLIVFLIAGSVIVFCAHLLHTATAMALRAETEAALVAREAQHRVGNILSLVQAVSRLSIRHASGIREFEERFHARLRALVEAQAVARSGPDLPADLAALLRAVLLPFDTGRIAISGPDAGIAERDRLMLALLVHELGTNAVTHGALSVPEGRLSITWTAGPELTLDWIESGGPPVLTPAREGFGGQIARSAFPPGRGSVVLDHDPAGLRCRVTLRGESAGRDAPATQAG